MKVRRSPALVVAVLALVVAMAGTSYAAVQITSAQIKNNSIKSKDIKDNQVSGKDVKDSSLTGADVQDNGLTGADVRDGSLTKADLASACPASTMAIQGACVDKTATGPTTYNVAVADCTGRNGRLMSADETFAVVDSGLTWANGQNNQYEFIGDAFYGATVEPVAVDHDLHPLPIVDRNAGTYWHRCVTTP